MLIGDYFAEISRLVHDHETAGFIQSSDFLTEARSDDLGYLIERLSFAYHYQSRSGDLRFRYDNAAHRPPAPLPVHKHLPNRILSAERLTLYEVLREIVSEYLKR